MKKKYVAYLCSFGHFCSDINQTALSALLPFIIAAYKFDYTTAAMLVMASNIVGSVIQPFIGQLADKKNCPWLMAVALLMAGGGIAVTGVIPSFFGMCIAVMISGVGIAMFHPQAAKLVNSASDDSNRGMSLSVFSFGGSIGSTIGPVLVTAFVGLFGIRGTLLFFVPELIVSALIMVSYKELVKLGKVEKVEEEKKAVVVNELANKDNWSAFVKLCVVMFGRSIIYSGLNMFLVLYWMNCLGQSQSASSLVLSVYYGFGAFCTLLGGKLADLFGYRNIVKGGFVVLAPAVAILAFTRNIAVAVVLLMLIGTAIQLVYSPMVVMGQAYLPNHVGLASGVTLGLAVSVGGIFAPLLGMVADHQGIVAVLVVIAVIGVIPMIGSFFLSPVHEKPQVEEHVEIVLSKA